MAETTIFRTTNNFETVKKKGAATASVGICWGQSIVWARRQTDKGAELDMKDASQIMSNGAALQFLYQYTETRGALTFTRWEAALSKYDFGLYKYVWDPSTYTATGALTWIKDNLKDKYVQINCNLSFGRHAMGLYFADADSYFFDANYGLRKFDTGDECLTSTSLYLTNDGFDPSAHLVALDLKQ